MSQFYPKFYTMIPAGLSVGFGGGLLWCAVAAEAYSQITGIKSDVLVILFFGLFFIFYQFAQVWGNLISSAVLSSGEPMLNATFVNETLQNVEDICGANITPNVTIAENLNMEPPAKEKIQLISGIYLGCVAAA
ncbi:uncharacterized protein CBL_01777 [Carabus blaptoides fortunei]